MHVVYLQGGSTPEAALADALRPGIEYFGDTFEAHRLKATDDVVPVPWADVVLMWGVKSRERFRGHTGRGYRVVVMDKGHLGEKRRNFVRFSVGAHQPSEYVMDIARPHDRFDALGLKLAPVRRDGGHVLMALSSQKYCDWHHYGDTNVYARKLASKIRRNSERPIIYRPKPSWKGAQDIGSVGGVRMSLPPEPLSDVLRGAHALVTHGSGVCLDALLAGVPVVAVGDAVTRAFYNVSIKRIETPRFPTDAQRKQFLANLAYCQWTLAEIASGTAWRHVRPWLAI